MAAFGRGAGVVVESRIGVAPKKVRLVVTCTHRKALPVQDFLQLRSLENSSARTRIRTWVHRLRDESTPSVQALNLYAGEQWGIVRRLTNTPMERGIQLELWICSAGYGLLPSDALIRPYSATFASGSPDTVPGGAIGAAQWWAGLAEWSGPAGHIRTLTELVSVDPTSRVIFALSASYARACQSDISEAISSAKTHQLSIISAGSSDSAWLGSRLLPADARLQQFLGGSRIALNVRTAEYLISNGLLDHGEMQLALADILARQAPLARLDRKRCSDAEVRSFIRSRLKVDNRESCSRLLREFRDSQRGCEQSRFAELFDTERRRTQ